MKYLKALRARNEALRECIQARHELQGSVSDLLLAHETHPAPLLAGAAGIGFLLAQFRVGSGLIRTGAVIASGPAWHLLRQFVNRID